MPGGNERTTTSTPQRESDTQRHETQTGTETSGDTPSRPLNNIPPGKRKYGGGRGVASRPAGPFPIRRSSHSVTRRAAFRSTDGPSRATYRAGSGRRVRRRSGGESGEGGVPARAITRCSRDGADRTPTPCLRHCTGGAKCPAAQPRTPPPLCIRWATACAQFTPACTRELCPTATHRSAGRHGLTTTRFARRGSLSQFCNTSAAAAIRPQRCKLRLSAVASLQRRRSDP